MSSASHTDSDASLPTATNDVERCERKRQYYRSLSTEDALTLLLERQSKTHRLTKQVCEHNDALIDVQCDVADQGDCASRERRAILDNQDVIRLEIETIDKRNKEILELLRQCAANANCSASESKSSETGAAGDASDCAAPSRNCLLEPFVALWRAVSRRPRQRTAYSRFERGELDQDFPDDNDGAVLTTDFSKTE